MIDRSEVLAVASDLSLTHDIVEKDYVLGWLLAGIYAQDGLASDWTFKGGTCLKKCYFETYRFSEDLDFTLGDEAHLDAEYLRSVFAAVSAWVYEESGLELPVELMRFDTYKNPRGRVTCEGRIYYRAPPVVAEEVRPSHVVGFVPLVGKLDEVGADLGPGGLGRRDRGLIDLLVGEVPIVACMCISGWDPGTRLRSRRRSAPA